MQFVCGKVTQALSPWYALERGPLTSANFQYTCDSFIHVFMQICNRLMMGIPPRVHSLQGRQETPPCIKRILEHDRAKRLKFTSDCPTLVFHFFFDIPQVVEIMHSKISLSCVCPFAWNALSPLHYMA